MLGKINFEILNSFINVIIMNVAQKYIDKLNKDRRKPPKLIENYLDRSIYILQEYKTIEIAKMKDTIVSINEKEQKEFVKFFEEDKEYEILCKELNFAFLLMIDTELQEKTLELIYDNVYEYKFLVNQEVITKKQVDFNKIIEKTNKKKINKLRIFNSLNQTYITP